MKTKEKIIIVLPKKASSRVELGLVELTKYLVDKLDLDTGYGLGGEYGYGVDYENDVFMMHRYCWCDEEDSCLWCMMNDPDENPNYKQMKDKLGKKFNNFWKEWGGAPTFFYKPTKAGCRWYKWIGRDTIQEGKLPKNWLKICKDSVK